MPITFILHVVFYVHMTKRIMQWTSCTVIQTEKYKTRSGVTEFDLWAAGTGCHSFLVNTLLWLPWHRASLAFPAAPSRLFWGRASFLLNSLPRCFASQPFFPWSVASISMDSLKRLSSAQAFLAQDQQLPMWRVQCLSNSVRPNWASSSFAARPPSSVLCRRDLPASDPRRHPSSSPSPLLSSLSVHGHFSLQMDPKSICPSHVLWHHTSPSLPSLSDFCDSLVIDSRHPPWPLPSSLHTSARMLFKKCKFNHVMFLLKILNVFSWELCLSSHHCILRV